MSQKTKPTRAERRRRSQARQGQPRPSREVVAHASAANGSKGAPPLPATQDPVKLGQVLAESGYFKDATSAAQAAVKVMAGQELGFGPIASITGIHIIEGKPSVGANLLAALVKKSERYDYKVVELTQDRCELQFTEKGEPLAPNSEFSMEDAKRAGLTQKHNWRHHPRNMLFARALSNGVKWHCPDLCGGAPIYLPDELDVEVTASGEPVAEVLPAPAASRPTVARPGAAAPRPTEETATPDQRRMIFARSKEAGLEESQLAAIVSAVAGSPHTDRLPKSKVDAVLAEIAKAAKAGGSS